MMTDPTDTPTSRGTAALAALMLAYAALFVAYYPPLAGIEDEVGYVNQALVWSRGALSAEGAGLPGLADFAQFGDRHYALRHPGRSLLALPFLALGGVRAVFLSGLVLHLATVALGAAVLRRLGRSPLWAALILFHPTLAVYSRTMMGDEAAGAGVLLAALLATVPGVAAAVGAGLAVGLAAVMRYHAALALPAVALVYLAPPRRPGAFRDAVACVLGAGAVGGLLVVYNLTLYGNPFDPYNAKNGAFSSQYFLPHLGFYAAALTAIWPLMLFAPLLDRSPLRWAARGTCGLFLLFVSFYYFHDRGPNLAATLVVGQRLLSVALPLWIVSYAVVLDDLVAGPLRRRLGRRAWAALIAAGCTGLLAATGLLFERHQEHLNRLLAARAAVRAAVPDGATVVGHGGIIKLFGIPMGPPSYRWRPLMFNTAVLATPGDPYLDAERRPWYLAVLNEAPGVPLPDAALALIDGYRMEPVATPDPRLDLYVARPGARR